MCVHQCTELEQAVQGSRRTLHLTHRPQACACVRAVSWQPAPTTAPGGGEAAHSHRVPVLHGPRRRLAQRARTGEPARRQPAVHLITPAPVSRRHEPLCQQRERLGVGMRARSAQRCRAHARLLARSLARALSLSLAVPAGCPMTLVRPTRGAWFPVLGAALGSAVAAAAAALPAPAGLPESGRSAQQKRTLVDAPFVQLRRRCIGPLAP